MTSLTRVGMTALFAVTLAIQGCSSEKFVGRSNLDLVPQGTLPQPSTKDLSTDPVAFVIGPADKLAISVYGIPEATLQVTVDPAGQISVPLAGNIQAAGNTPAQLASLVGERLRVGHVLNPVVSVNAVEIVSQSVTVSGQVARPGIYAISGRTTLTGAIARAEGLTDFGNEKYVVVFRTANAHEYAALYDLRAIRTGIYADPQVFPSDTIIVGESRARRLFRDVLAASGLITAPVVALIR